MGILTKSVAVALSVGVAGVGAGPAPAPQPLVTPAAILPRDDSKTLGWYSDGQTVGETICTRACLCRTLTQNADECARCAMGLRPGCNDIHLLGQLFSKMRSIKDLCHVHGLLKWVYGSCGHFLILVRETTGNLRTASYTDSAQWDQRRNGRSIIKLLQ